MQGLLRVWTASGPRRSMRLGVKLDVDLGEHGTAGIVDVVSVNERGEICRLAVYRR